MRSYRTLIVLAVVAGALAMPGSTALAQTGKAKVTVGDAALAPAVDVFPGSIYDNDRQRLDAEGEIVVDQPTNKKYMDIIIAATGLEPNFSHRIWVDWSGIALGDVSTANDWGFWTTVPTDEYGDLYYSYRLNAGDLPAGSYTISLFINQYGRHPVTKKWFDHTILISSNLVFDIQTL